MRRGRLKAAMFRRRWARNALVGVLVLVAGWSQVEPVQGQYAWDDADAIVDFAQQNGQTVRGHALVWHNSLPEWLTSGSFTDEQLRAILKQHIETMMTHYAGRVGVWDVVNEAFNEDGTLRQSIWLNRLGSGYIADAFRWARAADPAAKLYITISTPSGPTPRAMPCTRWSGICARRVCPSTGSVSRRT